MGGERSAPLFDFLYDFVIERPDIDCRELNADSFTLALVRLSSNLEIRTELL